MREFKNIKIEDRLGMIKENFSLLSYDEVNIILDGLKNDLLEIENEVSKFSEKIDDEYMEENEREYKKAFPNDADMAF